MENIMMNEDESLIRMQREMDDLKQRENELARKIAQANQRQKSLSRESLTNSRERGRSLGSPRKNSGGDSPTRDYFHGRNIESKVARYIRGEDPFNRKRFESDTRQQSSNRGSSSSLSPPRGNRSLRSSSNPDNSQQSTRQDTPRIKTSIGQEIGIHKSTPNLSTVKDPLFEDLEQISDDDGQLRSRSKKGTTAGRYSSTGNLDDIEIPENKLWNTSDQDNTRSSTSIELQISDLEKDSKKENPISNLIDFGEMKEESSNYERTEKEGNSTLNMFENRGNNTLEESGSAIDIDSIIWSGDTTREDGVDIEAEEISKKVTWSPDDILVSDEKRTNSELSFPLSSSMKSTSLPIELLNTKDKDFTFGTLSKETAEDDDSDEDMSARELILDAKSKIELEIEELQKREEELKSMRQRDNIQRKEVEEDRRKDDEEEDEEEEEEEEEEEGETEEFFEANETLASESKGIIEREIEEMKQRELEYKNRQKLIYGRILSEENDSEEYSDGEVHDGKSGSVPSGLKKDSRGKIEREMAESMQRESEYQNRLKSTVETNDLTLMQQDEEEESSESEEEEENRNTSVDAVTKIEMEIEEVKQREEELRRMRIASTLESERDEEEETSGSNDVDVDTEIDPLRKIEMEIEEDRKRDLELKRRYGLEGNQNEVNGVVENGSKTDEEEDIIISDVLPLNSEVESQQQRGNVPGKLRIPDAFQTIAKKSAVDVAPGMENKSKVLKETVQEEKRVFEPKLRQDKSASSQEASRKYYTESSEDEDMEDEENVGEEDTEDMEENTEDQNESEEESEEENIPTMVTKQQKPSIDTHDVKKHDDPDLATVKSGFTKERIFLFDPHKKPEVTKAKESRITIARKKFESGTQRIDSNSGKQKGLTRNGDDNVRQDINQGRIHDSKTKMGAISVNTATDDLHRQSGKKFILKKKSGSKVRNERDYNYNKGSGSDGQGRKEYIDHRMSNGDLSTNDMAYPAAAKQRKEDYDYEDAHPGKYQQDSYLYGKETDGISGESEIELRRRYLEEKRRKSDLTNSQKAQNISNEQLKKRDGKLESQRQKEKRRSMAELWEKNMLTKEDDIETTSSPQTKTEQTTKTKTKSQSKKTDSKKKATMLKASAQLRVQQWEQNYCFSRASTKQLDGLKNQGNR